MKSPSSAILASVLGAFAAQGLTLRMEERPKLGKKEVIQPHDIVCITKAQLKRERKAAKLARDNGNKRSS
jgi:hypothetical protein